MSNANLTGSNSVSPNSSGLTASGAGIAISGCFGPVRKFCSNNRSQHIQVLGGWGYGVKEESSTLCCGVSFRDTDAGPHPAGISVPDKGKGNRDTVWDRRELHSLRLCRETPVCGTSPADIGSAGPSPVSGAVASTSRMRSMIL